MLKSLCLKSVLENTYIYPGIVFVFYSFRYSHILSLLAWNGSNGQASFSVYSVLPLYSRGIAECSHNLFSAMSVWLVPAVRWLLTLQITHTRNQRGAFHCFLRDTKHMSTLELSYRWRVGLLLDTFLPEISKSAGSAWGKGAQLTVLQPRDNVIFQTTS